MGVLDDPFSNFEGQIQTAERGIAQLEVFNDSQGMQVVIEEGTVAAHGGVEGFLAGVAKGRVSNIVY